MNIMEFQPPQGSTTEFHKQVIMDMFIHSLDIPVKSSLLQHQLGNPNMTFHGCLDCAMALNHSHRLVQLQVPLPMSVDAKGDIVILGTT